MNKTNKMGLSLLLLASPASVVLAASNTPQSGINFGGNIEMDFNSTSTDLTDTTYDQSGRVKFQIDGRRDSGEYFVAGKGELLLQNDGGTETEDAWLMLGRSKHWNIRVGHFENSHMFPEGRDTVIEHADADLIVVGNAPVPYEMDEVRGRFDGGLRLRIQSVENWLLELGTRYGGDGDDEDPISGIRPVAIYTNDDITFRIGAEAVDDGVTKLTGFGTSFGFMAGGASINLNLTQLDDDANAFESTTIGANVSINSFTIGVYAVDSDYDTGLDPTLTTVYGSYKHMISGIDEAYLTYGFSTSSADDVAVGSDDEITALKVRLNYEF